MAHVEFTGKDLEEAIAKAAAALSLPPEQVRFSVVSMGTKGFLGLGRRQARIAVDPDDPALTIEAEAPAERRKKADPAPAPAGPAKESGERQNRERKKSPAPVAPVPVSSAQAEKKAEAPQESGRNKPESRKTEEAAPDKKYPRERRPDKKDKARERAAGPEVLPLDWSHLPPVLTKPGRDEVLAEGTVDQAGELALSATREILARMGFEAEVSAARLGGRIVLSLESADNALLIGARGATLEALQLLVNKIVARRLAEAADAPADCRVVLDVADYRARRRELLLENLKNVSEQVRQTRKPQALTGLNSDERRLIQLALRPFRDLHVLSSGGREALTISPHPPRPRRKGSGGQQS